MEQITTIIKKRKTFKSVTECQEEKEYKVFVTSDGEEFPSILAAKKYQKEYNRVENFKQHFNLSKGNLKKGDILLARDVASIKDISLIKDYFWIKFKTVDEIDVMTNFCIQQYSMLKKDIKFIASQFVVNKWFFIVIAKNQNAMAYNAKQKFLSVCDLTYINEKIQALKSLIPNFSNTDKQVKEKTGEDENNQFSLLDIR